MPQRISIRILSLASNKEIGAALSIKEGTVVAYIKRIADRTGLRLSPSAIVNGAPDPTGFETFSSLLRELQRFELE